MKIAIVAPSPVPFAQGGAENLWRGLYEFLDRQTPHAVELIKLPAPESGVWELLDSYRRFSALDLSHFDVVVSGKYPAWMVEHPHHVCYMVHRLRGLYDTYGHSGKPRRLESAHPGLQSLGQFIEAQAGRREALPEFFQRIEELRRRGDLPDEVLAFPGPWIRSLVHYLDDIALGPEAIRRHAAISRNLIRRPGYFPAGVEVRALHPPSSLEGLRCEEGRHFFTISRLDGPKRVGLLVQGMRLARTRLPLLIAGVGPEEDALRELAGEDPRIRFLGRVGDREAADLYARSVGVLYAPLDEDYGLVTYEAMASGKPVITTRDSGGPLELVDDAETGFVVAPEPAKIAERIDALAEHPDQARALGSRGAKRAEAITWDGVVTGLLDGAPGPPRRLAAAPARERLVVATTFPIHPPTGGGQVRTFELYRRLARTFDVAVVGLASDGRSRERREISPGIVEHRIPMTPQHARAERRASKQVDWVPLTDVAFPRFHALTPAYAAALAEQIPGARAVIASHPFAFDAIEGLRGGVPLWYEAHNVELDLKQQVLPDTDAGREWIEETRRVEAACCGSAELVFAASPMDLRRLAELYPLPDRVEVVPNGVDVEAIPFVAPDQRRRNQRDLGIGDGFSAVFLGSWHPPNLVAARHLVEMAPSLPDVRFLIVGGVGGAFDPEELPANVALTGVVEQDVKALLLGSVDVALNPMTQGSGTNLKMLEYCAAGVPVITTPLGTRGIELHDDEHLCVADLADFPRRIEREARDRDSRERAARVRRARVQVERFYDWRVVATRLSRAVAELPTRGSEPPEPQASG